VEALQHGSIAIIFAWLVAGGLGAPLPEDVALLAAGALIERGASPLATFAVVIAGVLVGDAVLFFGARKLGPAALARQPFARILPPERRARIERAYHRRGGAVVFVARNIAGLRAAAFAMAGIAGMAPRRFFAWDALAACVGVPLFLALGYLGAEHVETVRAGIAAAQRVLVAAAVAAVAAYVIWSRLPSASRRARARDRACPARSSPPRGEPSGT